MSLESKAIKHFEMELKYLDIEEEKIINNITEMCDKLAEIQEEQTRTLGILSILDNIIEEEIQ